MKKKFKKIIAIGGTLLMLLAPMAAYAQPAYYVGDKKFLSSDIASDTAFLGRLNQLLNDTGGFENLVLHLDDKGTANYKAFKDAYPNGGIAEFIEFARLHPWVIPSTAMVVHPVGPETPDPERYIEPPVAAPVVLSASAVNATTITVTFNKAVSAAPANFVIAGHTVSNVAMSTDAKTATLTVAPGLEGNVPHLVAISNVTAQDGGVLVTDGKTVTNVVPEPPQPTKAAVESATFISYRHLRVNFNKEVDLKSAANPANYYFEIVDGNAGLFGASPTLGESNQLSQIETTYPGGAPAYYNPLIENIVAYNNQGATVVDISLPEDARFTNIFDSLLRYDALGEDDERTLVVRQRASQTKPGMEIQKALIKNTIVNVAVRNVKDADGNLSIDTAVKPITILDEVRPSLLQVYKVRNFTEEKVEGPSPNFGAQNPGLGKDLGTFELVRNWHKQGRDQVGQKLVFEYSEPVFDGHDLDKSDLESVRDLSLYVNGKKIASQKDGNLAQYMTFQMYADGNYHEARMVDLDVQKAVKAADGEYFTTGKNYNVYFVGVTDLAGNIEVASEHYFNVRFYDEEVPPPVLPEVLNIVQVADNMFRVEFNRVDAEGKLVIENSDGEGGVLKVNIPKAQRHLDVTEDLQIIEHFFSYVEVPTMDNELFDPVLNVNVTKEGCWLAYDGQDYINRVVKAKDIIVRDDDDTSGRLLGNDYDAGTMKLVNDILSPVAETPDEIGYYDRYENKIEIPVKDIVPWVDQAGENIDDNIIYDVKAVKFNYNPETKKFENEIDHPESNRDYLPIRVSYVDAAGATHSAVVTNRDLRPYDDLGEDPTYLNPGFEESIEFDGVKNELVLDLTNYPELLDHHGKLVAGAHYSIEIPKGYFTDPARDIIMTPFMGSSDIDFIFGPYEYDMLYVDDARIPQLASIIDQISELERARCLPKWKELGYTSIEQTVIADIGVKPAEESYVPQTSKELIRYDQPTNSLWIEFTGTIDVDTLKDRSNYSFNGKTLKEWDTLLGTNTVIDYELRGDQQFARFTIPQDSVREDGDVSFTVSGVANPEGGTMTPVSTVVALLDNCRPVVVDARTAGQRQIVLTFDEPVQYLVDPVVMADQFSAAKNFNVTAGGVQLTVLGAVLPERLLGGSGNIPSDRELTLNLGSDIPAAGDLKVEIVKDQNQNILIIDMSDNRNPLKLAQYPVSRP